MRPAARAFDIEGQCYADIAGGGACGVLGDVDHVHHRARRGVVVFKNEVFGGYDSKQSHGNQEEK